MTRTFDRAQIERPVHVDLAVSGEPSLRLANLAQEPLDEALLLRQLEPVQRLGRLLDQLLEAVLVRVAVSKRPAGRPSAGARMEEGFLEKGTFVALGPRSRIPSAVLLREGSILPGNFGDLDEEIVGGVFDDPQSGAGTDPPRLCLDGTIDCGRAMLPSLSRRSLIVTSARRSLRRP